MNELIKVRELEKILAILPLIEMAVSYVFLAIILNRLMKKQGRPGLAIVAFVPFFNVYLLGILAGDLKILPGVKLNKEAAGLILVAIGLLRTFFVVHLLILLPLVLFSLYVIFNVIKNLGEEPGKAFVYCVISAIFPLFLSLYLYQMGRNIEYN